MASLRRLSATASATLKHSLRHLSTRSYHITAEAQPQFDHDIYRNNNNFDDISGAERVAIPIPAVNSEGSRTCRGVQWVFLGNPDSKKRVYAEMVSKLLRIPHISITGLLRQDLNPNSPLYKKIAEAVNCKKIVPETIIFGLLSKRLEDGHYRGETGFILDGIPRTRLQAEVLDQLLEIDLVVNFKRCGDHFHAERSATEVTKPNVTTFYREQRILLEEYYQNQKKLIDFPVGDVPGETWKGLVAALHLQHISAVDRSRRLSLGFRVP